MTHTAAPTRNSNTALQVLRYLSLGLAASILACAPGDVKAGLGPNEPEAAVVVLAPTQDSIVVGQVVLIAASARTSTGQPAPAEVDWSADGGTLTILTDSTAQFSAVNPGSYTVRGRGRKAPHPKDSTIIVVDPPVSPVVSIAVSPASVTLGVGGVQAFVVTATRQDGSTMTPGVTWSATGGTVDAAGIYRAGNTAGTFRVIAVQQGGTLADTSSVTLTAAPPVLQAVILSPGSASLAAGATQQFTVAGQWSDGSTTAPAVTYSATGGSISTGGLYAAGSAAGSFRVIARQQSGTLADTALISVSAGSGGGPILLSEGFEDGSISGRGWFDATTIATAADARPGSSGARVLEWHWTNGMTAPQGSSRKDFTPSNSVYLSYWVKTSANWTGSGRAYHPHMFHFLTTADDRYIGPSMTHLTLYDELLYVPSQGGLVPVLQMQDALMIDPANLMVDLTSVTEQRAIGGYNGRPEQGLGWDAFSYGGGQYTNYKMFKPGILVMTDANKSSWHHVESYWQMNTISGGKGQRDGVVQYWFDGSLLIDRHDIYFRTAVNSTMQFRTFVMAPYIGDGSPMDQFMWIDDLEVRTARP